MSTEEQRQQTVVGRVIAEEKVRQFLAHNKLLQLEVRIEHLEQTIYQLLTFTEQLYTIVEKLLRASAQEQRNNENVVAALQQRLQKTHQIIQLSEERKKRSGL